MWVSFNGLYKIFDKRENGVGLQKNIELCYEPHKAIAKKLSGQNVVPISFYFKWGVDLADKQLLSKSNDGVKFILGVIDIH